MEPPIRDHCIRCGTCCSKGGPTLHFDDLKLFETGILKPAHVYTLRRGETVYENIADKQVQLKREMIKIKEMEGSRTCMFYDCREKACSIYVNRPLQCRVLACWDTRELEQVFALPKITRRDLLPPTIPLLDIIDAHDERCSPAKLAEMLEQLSGPNAERAFEAAMDMVQYDAAMRPFMARRLAVHPDELDFFFGRPLATIIRAFGLILEKREGEIRLTPEVKVDR